MVKSNCTQYCEVHDQADFNLCTNGDRGVAGNVSSDSRNSSSSTSGFYDTLCKNANVNASGANASGVGGVEGKFPFSQSLLCGSDFVCVCFADVGHLLFRIHVSGWQVCCVRLFDSVSCFVYYGV
jgi:hypothetical protein